MGAVVGEHPRLAAADADATYLGAVESGMGDAEAIKFSIDQAAKKATGTGSYADVGEAFIARRGGRGGFAPESRG
jgi:hypothetical protein